MRKRRAFACLLVLLASGGCGGPSAQPDVEGRAAALWSSRIANVGDNSGVTALVGEIGFAPAGSYSIELRTAQPPYALTIALQRPAKPFDDTDYSSQATLLLGLVANLDEVSVTAGQDSYSLSATAASQDLGHDVKQLGRDRATLVRYLKRTSD